MTIHYDAIYKVLDKTGEDFDLAAEEIFDGPKKICMEVLRTGLMTIAGRRRRTTRREFKREIQPKFERTINGGSVFTEASKKKIAGYTKKLFGSDGWKIGRYLLADFTKEELLEQAARERKSARGHIENAEIYEALAAPLKPGQTVQEYWKEDEVMAIKDKVQKKSKDQKVGFVD